MTWLDLPLFALDTETTSADPTEARIVQVAIGHSSGPGQWAPWTRLINPGVPIPAEATAVHGFTDERVQAEGWCSATALGRIYAMLRTAAARKQPVVAHNAPFDLTVLDREFRRHLGRTLPDGLIVLDTLCLHRRFNSQSGSRSLGKLAERHGITFPAHDAEADALASLRLLHILAGLNDALPLIPARDLHAAQGRWWVQQQDAAGARALGNGTAFTRQDHWPLIPA